MKVELSVIVVVQQLVATRRHGPDMRLNPEGQVESQPVPVAIDNTVMIHRAISSTGFLEVPECVGSCPFGPGVSQTSLDRSPVPTRWPRSPHV